MSDSPAAVTLYELVGTVECEEGKAQFLMMSSRLSLTQNGNPYIQTPSPSANDVTAPGPSNEFCL
jgi:hypothetical protein